MEPMEDDEEDIFFSDLSTAPNLPASGDRDSTLTDQALTFALDLGPPSPSRGRSRSIYEELDEISTNSQNLNLMENLLRGDAIEISGQLPELSAQFLDVHLNSQSYSSTFSSTSSVFNSTGDNFEVTASSSATTGDPCHDPFSPATPFSPPVHFKDLSMHPSSRHFSARGRLQVKQLLQHKLQGRRGRIYSDPTQPAVAMSPGDPGRGQLRSDSVSVGGHAESRIEDDISRRRTSLVIQKRKERNRISAAKCREKQKSKHRHLESEKEKLTEDNQNLSREVEQLELEKRKLQTLVLTHSEECLVLQQQSSSSSFQTPTTENNPVEEPEIG